MDILHLQQKCTPQGEILFVDNSIISLSQFYGIELLDFPHEVAMLSLWLAEHQMNTKLNEDFGVNTKTLPLKNITQIVCGNACRLDWNTVCPHTSDEEVFVFGNPPYLGSRNQDDNQKADLDYVFTKDFVGYRKLDYIACWFYKGAEYIQKSSAKYAFVSTNSIVLGEQVPILWDKLFAKFGLEFYFAYTVFKWQNNAKYNAAVSVIILSLANISNAPKYIYTDSEKKQVQIIPPSLNENAVFNVDKQTTQISGFPEMRRGNMPNDKEFLRLSPIERNKILEDYPEADKFIRVQIGADEFINGLLRYCYWISDKELDKALQIEPIRIAVEKVREYRINSKDKTLHVQANKPHQMREFFECGDYSLLIPIVSSESREYIPIGFVPKYTIVPNSAQVIYNANSFLMGVLTSKMHMIWTKYNAGRLDNRIRYSIFLCYNTFPFPKISAEKKKEIEAAAENVLITREYYPEKTLADLYDPEKMPKNLREAHEKLDDIVESCYPGYPFASDEARLECLFKQYEKMTAAKK